MAYAVVYSLAQTIDQILNHDEYPLSEIGKQQIHMLKKNVFSLINFLKWFKEEGSSLERRIRDAANEAEDVIEHWMHEHIRSTAAGLATDIEYDLGELNMVMEEINSISKEVDLIKPWPSPKMLQSRPPMSTCIRDGFTVGLEEDLKKIKGLVLGESPYLEIIQITGMGGIGKTTLAKEVYHDELIKETFPFRAWVTVSQDYHNVENIFADLLRSFGGNVESNGEPAIYSLYSMLIFKKYLIVLDDVWSAEALNGIMRAFPNDRNGSRIMLTTRIESVASYDQMHKMQLIGPSQSWELLKQKVFQSEKCPSELEKIGKDIAKGCKGLPLAVVVAARILSQRSQTQSSWEDVAQNIRSLIQNDEHFEKTMSLSYTYLHRRLRPFFIYMCGFPEAYEIRVSMLIKLFMAEGFVKDQVKGEEYLIELERQNLILDKAIKSNGKVKSYSVHGLLRDLCNIKALDENYERRLSNSHLDLREVARAYASTMRSVISFQRNESSLRGLRKFKLLRVLDVVDTNAYSLPPSLFELFHLRYLAFGCPMEVPSAISRLENLRALIIRPGKRSRKYSRDEVYLPLEIWMMPLLTHLVSFFDLLPNPEGAASALKELLTLAVVKKLICTEELMKLICNVKKLAINYFGDKYQQDYQLENLVLLSQLEKLTLVVTKGSHLQKKARPIFPKTLKKLTLSGWRFPWEDMKAIATLPNLEVLKLRDHAFQGDTWSTIEESYGDKDGEDFEVNPFVKLKYLLIEESDLQEWIIDNCHFQALKRLVLKGCDKLNQIPKHIGYIASALTFEVDSANLSLLNCVKEIQQDQEIYGKIVKVDLL